MDAKVLVKVTFRNISSKLIERTVYLDERQYEQVKRMKEAGDDRYVASYLEALAEMQEEKQ
ncbi:MAG: hypothetical protein AABW80_04170 [Nanoarchaeota archaeon]